MTNCNYPIITCKYHIINCKYPIIKCNYPSINYKYPIRNCKYPIRNCKYPIINCKYQIVNEKYPIKKHANTQLQTTNTNSLNVFYPDLHNANFFNSGRLAEAQSWQNTWQFLSSLAWNTTLKNRTNGDQSHHVVLCQKMSKYSKGILHSKHKTLFLS